MYKSFMRHPSFFLSFNQYVYSWHPSAPELPDPPSVAQNVLFKAAIMVLQANDEGYLMVVSTERPLDSIITMADGDELLLVDNAPCRKLLEGVGGGKAFAIALSKLAIDSEWVFAILTLFGYGFSP